MVIALADQVVVPWGLSWIGLAVAVSGAILACWAAVRGKRLLDRIGWAVFVLGALTMLYPPLFNGTMFLARVLIEQIQPKTLSENPDRTAGVSFTFVLGL